MDKHTNPFHAFAESISVLAGLGVNPMHSGATCTEDKPGWVEEVLGISVDRRYANGTHYYVVSVHLTELGFDNLLYDLNCVTIVHASRESHSNEFDMLFVELSPLFKIFCLVPKEPDLAPGGETL